LRNAEAQREITDAWFAIEIEYRQHLVAKGFSSSAIDAICARMERHFRAADVQLGVWGKMPVPDGVTPAQEAEIVATFSELVAGMASEVQRHTKRMLWELFELEVLLETRARDGFFVVDACRRH
jgi:hypothetical protein